MGRNFRTSSGPAFVPIESKGLKMKGAAVFGNTSGPLKSNCTRDCNLYGVCASSAIAVESAVIPTGRPRPIRGSSRANFTLGAGFGVRAFRAPEASPVRDGYPSPNKADLAYPARA
jgi:hypothetical protein